MNYNLIGIDGGATKVSGAIIKQINQNSFDLASDVTTVLIKDSPFYSTDFKPVEIDALQVSLSNEEERQGIAYVEACEKVVTDLIEQNQFENPNIGIGMPGLKTDNLRGIQFMNNGPRIPSILDVLEHRLAMAEIKHQPIVRLGNDSDYCGLGEFYSPNGSLRAVTNAYYIGGGTGIADAIVLDGKPVPFDEVQVWMKKTWDLKNENGISLETLISQQGIINQYAEQTGKSVIELENDGIFPAKILKENKEIEIQFVETIAYLFKDRIHSLFVEKNQIFDRIVIGLRLGKLLNNNSELLDSIIKLLLNQISKSVILDPTAQDHYLQKNFIVISELNHAPIIGAGVDAYYATQ